MSSDEAKPQGAMHVGALLVTLSAVLHLLAPVVSGFGSEALSLLISGALYGALAYGISRGQRWLAYVAFLALFVETSMAFSRLWSTGDVPGWLYACIAAANLASVAILFAALWRSPKASV